MDYFLERECNVCISGRMNLLNNDEILENDTKNTKTIELTTTSRGKILKYRDSAEP